ncbi:hypothetical protein [Sphingomonas jaspsi]|uniref:hypothetical protein n=1 Tax=Sphingomonas jaspsi TaxID=392409 RepID=UPI0004B66F3B|nr:hypothetical protein [Sphingomonas jaspsi]
MAQPDEARIFMVYAIVRLIGLATFLLGVAIAFSDLLQPGGWPLVGGLLAVVGVLDAVIAPPLIRRAMEKK